MAEAQRGPTPRQVFGKMVAFYRERAGLSRAELAKAICKSVSLVQAIELGARSATADVTDDLERVLKTDGALIELRQQMREGLIYQAFPGWFQEWAHLVAEALKLRFYEPMVVPGLLQTEAYARAIFAAWFGMTEDKIDDAVALRVQRQEILARDKPPTLWVILEEWVLRRPVGGPHVILEQINRLIEAARQPHISIEIIPAEVGAHMGVAGAFAIADFVDAPSVAYQEGAVRGQRVEERADVASLELTWDTLRGVTLPRAASLNVLEEMAKSCTSTT